MRTVYSKGVDDNKAAQAGCTLNQCISILFCWYPSTALVRNVDTFAKMHNFDAVSTCLTFHQTCCSGIENQDHEDTSSLTAVCEPRDRSNRCGLLLSMLQIAFGLVSLAPDIGFSVAGLSSSVNFDGIDASLPLSDR